MACAAIRESFHRKRRIGYKEMRRESQDRTRPMGRYRAPAEAGSKYITPAGRAAPARGAGAAVARASARGSPQAVAAAAAQGDRSENAEYTYGKKRLREIDRRVRFLRRRLEGMVIVDAAALGPRARVLRRLGGAGGRGRRAHSPPHRRSRRVRPVAPATSAWTRRWAGRCWASRWTLKFSVATAGGERRFVIVAIEYPCKPSRLQPYRSRARS